MVKKALIEICGVQHYEDFSDTVKHKFLGTFEETEGAYILSYNEERKRSVTLKAFKDRTRVELIRNRSALIIEPDRRYICEYSTEAGQALLGIKGSAVSAEVGEADGTLYFTYETDTQNRHISDNEVTVKFRFKI